MIRNFPLGKALIMEVGAGEKSVKQLHSIQRKLYEDINIEPKLAVRGFPVSSSALLPAGTPIYAAHFVPGQFVDVRSKSYSPQYSPPLISYFLELGRDSKVPW